MNTLRRFSCILLMLALLWGGYPFPTRASAPDSRQSFTQAEVQYRPSLAPDTALEPGVDCGCNKTGQFRGPGNGKTPEVDTDGTSPNDVYKLQVSGSSILYFTILKVADNSLVVSFSGPGGGWGFSPDDNRFAYWYVYNGVTTFILYNLEAPSGDQQIWTTSGAFGAVEVLFSPTGKYFFLATLVSSNTANLLILDAQNGAQRYTDQFVFSSPPGGPGDKFGLAGYGFSPDSKDRTFVYSFVVDATKVDLNVVNLKTGAVLLEQNIPFIAELSQFSRCGDRLGLVNQTDASHVQVDLLRTLDGSPAGGVSPVGLASVVLTTTLASHLAYIGGSTYTLGSNSAPAACPVTPALDSIHLASANVVGGNPVNGTVALNIPALSGGATVSLDSDKPGAAVVPPTVTIPAGSLTASFTVTTFQVSTPTDVALTASMNGNTVTETLHVTQSVLKAITSSSTVKPGGTITVTVTLAGKAPPGGVDVSISSSLPALVQTPAVVHIPAGKSSANLELVPGPVSDSTAVILSASLNNVTQTTQVILLPPPPKLDAFEIRPPVVKGGNYATGVITLTKAVPVGMGMVTVNISNSNPGAVSMSNKLSISERDRSGSFWITTYGVSAAFSVTVTTGLDGITRTSTLLVQPADLSEFSFDATCGVVLKDPAAKASIAGYPIKSRLSLDGAAPPGGAVVYLESSNPGLIQVPATVTIEDSYTDETFATHEVVQPTLVTLTANYRGVEISMPITLTKVPTYTVTKLPFSPAAINDAGQIAGKSFIMSNGVVTDLNTLLGGSLDILHMNENGDLLASGQKDGLDGYYYIDKTGLTPIYTWDLDGEPQLLWAEGMNDQGEVVGEYFENIIGTPWHAFRWKGGVTTPLESPGGWIAAVDINNHGVIAGNSLTGGVTGAVLWIGDLMAPLGLNPYDNTGSQAMAVNDAGTVAIQSWQVFLWKNGSYSPVLMPKPGQHAVFVRALNQQDDMLISARYMDPEEQAYLEPVIHNQHGTYMLNCAAKLEDGSRISDVTDLNNLGQIVGTLKVPGQDEEVGILLNPSDLPQMEGVQIFSANHPAVSGRVYLRESSVFLGTETDRRRFDVTRDNY